MKVNIWNYQYIHIYIYIYIYIHVLYCIDHLIRFKSIALEKLHDLC